MRRLIVALFLLGALPGVLCAQNATTALNAIKLLPKPDAKRVVRIVAREGAPTPERWYILVHNPKEESGVKEYVVAGGQLVANRGLSQFAETLKADDVVGSESLKVDSDRAEQVAQQFAEANNEVAATFNYELKKEPDTSRPAWTVTCLDESGKRLGEVVVAAGKGGVLSHSGFANEPSADKLEKLDKPEKSKSDSDEERDSRSSRKRYVAKYRPMQAPPRQPEKPNPWSGLRKLFGGH